MSQKGRLNREVTTHECNWLKEDLPKGLKVHKFNGYTYGCIESGVAVTIKPWWHWILFWRKPPFFEVPSDAVGWK